MDVEGEDQDERSEVVGVGMWEDLTVRLLALPTLQQLVSWHLQLARDHSVQQQSSRPSTRGRESVHKCPSSALRLGMVLGLRPCTASFVLVACRSRPLWVGTRSRARSYW